MNEYNPLTTALNNWSNVFARRSIHDFLQYTRQYGLAMTHINILMQLFHRGPTSIMAIRSTMEGSKASATQLVDKLVSMGLVERFEDPVDRRVKNLSLTNSGRDLIEKSINAQKKWMEDLAASFDDSQQKYLAECLRQITDKSLEQENKIIPIRK